MKYDVKFISYPHSGRTWFRFLLMKLYSLYDKQTEILTTDLVLDGLPAIQFNHDTAIEKEFGTLEELIERNKDYKIILLMRDPRDIVISFYFRPSHRIIKNFNYFDFKNQKPYPLNMWIKNGIFVHVLNWISLWNEAINSDKLDLKLIRYEDFLRDPFKEMCGLLSFLHIDVPNKFVESSIKYASFKNMEKIQKEAKIDLARKWLIPREYKITIVGDNIDIYFSTPGKLRKGIVGDYKNQLSEDSIAYCNDLIKNSNCGLLERYET